jgi:hypothetical protein
VNRGDRGEVVGGEVEGFDEVKVGRRVGVVDNENATFACDEKRSEQTVDEGARERIENEPPIRSTAAATIKPPMFSTTSNRLPGCTFAMASMLARVSGRSSRVFEGTFSKWYCVISWTVGSRGVKIWRYLL